MECVGAHSRRDAECPLRDLLLNRASHFDTAAISSDIDRGLQSPIRSTTAAVGRRMPIRRSCPAWR
jgi:hypothetical protein